MSFSSTFADDLYLITAIPIAWAESTREGTWSVVGVVNRHHYMADGNRLAQYIIDH